MESIYDENYKGYSIKIIPDECICESPREWEVKRISKKLYDKVIENLKGEIKVYDDYLRGNVYGFVIKDSEGNDVDSCWGFYGDYDSENGCLEEAQSIVDYQVKENRKNHIAKLKSWIKNNVDISYRKPYKEVVNVC